MKILRFLIAIPVVIVMIVFAKIAQYAAVDAFGGRLGFELASLLGVLPVIAFYIWLAARYPHYFKPGFIRGR